MVILCQEGLCVGSKEKGSSNVPSHDIFLYALSRSTTTGEGPVHLERLQQTAHLGRDQSLGKALHLLLLSDVNGK